MTIGPAPARDTPAPLAILTSTCHKLNIGKLFAAQVNITKSETREWPIVYRRKPTAKQHPRDLILQQDEKYFNFSSLHDVLYQFHFDFPR